MTEMKLNKSELDIIERSLNMRIGFLLTNGREAEMKEAEALLDRVTAERHK